LPSDQQAALSDGVAELPPSVTEWATSSETLMGGQPLPAAGFALEAPLFTVTVSDLPEFQWRALPEADEYTIALFDEDLTCAVGSSRAVPGHVGGDGGAPRTSLARRA
jgi:hypothetical protein